MSHTTDEIPDSVPPGNGAQGPDDPPTLAAEAGFEVEEQTPDGGRPAPAPPDDEPDEPPAAAAGSPAADDDDEEEKPQLVWYVLKVQSSREDTIRDALERRVKIQGLQ